MKMSNDRGGFEKSWEKAFENAGMNPPDSIWNNIERELNKSGRKSSRKFLFVKLAAAASVVFALSLTFYGTLFDKKDIDLADDRSKVSKQSSDIPEKSVPEYAENRSFFDSAEQEDSAEEDIQNLSDKKNPATANQKALRRDASLSSSEDINLASSGRTGENSTGEGFTFSSEKDLPVERGELHASGNQNTEFAGQSELAVLAKNGLQARTTEPGEIGEIEVYPMGYDLIGVEQKKKKDRDNLFLAGVNYSAGTFDQGVTASTADGLGTQNSDRLLSSGRTAQEYATSVNAVNNSLMIRENGSYEQAQAFSYGANLGYKVTRRFIIFSGINYTKAYSKFNSNLSITENGNKLATTVMTNKTSAQADFSEVQNNDLNIDNTFEFASVPIKAGYMVLDSRINLTVLTGVSSEFLLNSSFSGEGESSITLASEMEDLKKDSYNSVYFNGILGVNLGYTFFENYRISVEPSVRKSLSSFSESEREVSRPLYKMISFGLTYQF